MTVLSLLLTVLVFVLTISALVFIHEGGHFLVAKWARVWVHEFAIGLGPAVWRRKRGETEYTVRAFPLGGYVRMAGEDGEGEEDREIPRDRLFSAKSGWARTGIIVAGPLMNVVAALLLMIAYVGIFGTPYVEVSEVAASSPAQGVLESGDKIVRLGGEAIYFPGQIQTLVQRSEGRALEAVIDRGAEHRRVTVAPYWSKERGQYLIGVYFTYPLPRIGRVPANSGLDEQGLEVGDEVLAVQGTPIGSGPEFIEALTVARGEGEPVSLTVRRAGEATQLTVDASQLNLEEIRGSFAAVQLPPSRSVVERVAPGSIWAGKGIRPGDRLISANGDAIHGTANLLKAILGARGGEGKLTVTLERDGVRRTATLSVADVGVESALSGLQLRGAQRMPESPWASVSIGTQQVKNVLVVTYLGIKQIVTGQMSAENAVVGPVGIADLLGRSLDLGVDYFIRLVAILSLMLGIFNLLPFPALDGSRIVFVAVNGLLKAVMGKPIPPEKEGWIHYIGFMLLMVLVLVITWNDIQRIFQGGGF